MITSGQFKFTDQGLSVQDRFEWIKSLRYETFKPEVNNEKVFEVDLNTRTIVVPKNQSELGVQDDMSAEVFWFAVPRYFEGHDLAENNKKWLVHVYTANKDPEAREILLPIKYRETQKADENNRLSNIDFTATVSTANGIKRESTPGILLGWPITYDITKYPGNVSFALRCYEIGTEGAEKDQIIFSLGTKPATGKITQSYSFDTGLIPDESESVFPTKSIVMDMLDQLMQVFGDEGFAQINYSDIGPNGRPTIGGVELAPHTQIKFPSINNTSIVNSEENFQLATSAELNETKNTLNAQATNLNSKIENVQKEASSNLSSEIAAVNEDISSNVKSINNLNADMKAANSRLTVAEGDILNLKTALGTEGGNGTSLTERVAANEEDIAEIQEMIGGGEGSEDSLVDRIESLENILGGGEGVEVPEGSLPAQVAANAAAITAIKDGTELDSFADVEAALEEVGVKPEDRQAIIDEAVSKADKNETIASTIANVTSILADAPVDLKSFAEVNAKLAEVGVSEQDRADIISAAVAKAHENETISAKLEDVSKNSTDVSALKLSVEDMNKRLINAEDGDNDELKLTYDETASILYLHTGDAVAEDGSNVLGQTVIKGGGGGGATSTYTLNLQVEDEKTALTVLKGRDANISFTPILKSEGESVGNTETVTLYLYVNDALKTSFTQKSNEKNTINIKQYLSSGFNTIKLTASYSEVIQETGQVIPVRSTKRWSFDVIEMYIESNFSDAVAVEDSKVTFTYTPYGNLEKTIYFYLNGKEYNKVVTEISDRSQSIEIKSPGHGVHSFEVWCTGVVEGETIESERLHYEIMFAEAGNNTPLIRIKAEKDTAQQYTTSTILYTVYKADSLNNEITFYVNGEAIGQKTVGRSEDKWFYKPMDFGTKELTIGCAGHMSEVLTLEVAKFPYDISPITANLEVDFNPVGRTNQDKDFNVFKNNAFDDNGNEKEITWELSDNFDWVNGGWQTDADGNGYFCVKAGTTATINYNMFADPYTVIGANSATGKGKEFKMIFKTTNVADVTATFLECQAPPSAGTNNVGLEMKVHHGYVKSNNDTLEIPYAEEDIVEFDFNINPASLVNGSIDTTAEVIPMILSYEDGVPFLPKTYTSTATSFTQATPVPITIGSMDCDVHIYRMKCYSSYLSNEDVLNNFIADGKNADEMIERFTRNQIYDKGKLTPESLANARPDLKVIKISCPYFTNDKDNFVGDTSVQMIHRNGDPALDNWTFSNGYHSGQGTSSNKYGDAARNIDLLMCFDGVYKHKKVLKLFEGREDEYWAIRSKFESADGSIKIEDGTGKVGLTRTSVPTSYFNIKVNVASSENTNNATLANRFDRFLPYTSVGKKRDPFVKNTMEFVNCVVFLQETDPDISKHREFQDTEWHYYAIGNIGDSKKTDQTRAYDPDDKKEFVVEIMDNNMPNAAFQTGFTNPENPLEIKYPITKAEWVEGNEAYDALYSDGWDGKKSFEMRYEHPKASDEQSEANIAKWNEFYEWVIMSTDEEFKSQLKTWVNLPAAYYYYLFTERYTMMDNRAKNSFWHWSKLYITQAEVTAAADELKAAQDALAALQGAETPNEEAIAAAEALVAEKEAKNAWALRYNIDDTEAAINEGYRFDWWDYDNDTSLGIDNSGTLRMPYGKEDIDTEVKEDGSINYYFNAGNSVFYRRLRENFVSELETAYNKAEESKCFDAQNLIDEFDERQSEFPEAIWNENFERLYARTYRAGTPDHLNKRYTGRKKYHRRQWERDQSAYMSSKYKTLMSRDLQILMRCKTPSGVAVPPKYDMNLIPYSDMYLNVQFGPNYIESIRAEAGKEYVIKSPFSDMTDNQVAVFNGQKIQSVGDISTFYPSEGTFGTAEKLKTLIIGNGTPGYANSYLTTLTTSVNNKLLEYLDIQNLTSLKTVYLQIQNLKHFYAQGSGITDAVFANNGLLEEAYLPAAINTVIANNLYYLHTLEFEGYDALNKLVISNCPKVDELDIVQKSPNLTIVRLIDIDWSGTRALDDATLLNRLLECSGIQEDGLTPLDQSVLTGHVVVNSIRQSEIDAFKKAWPELDVQWKEIIPQVDLKFYNEGADINTDEPIIQFKVDLNDTLYPAKYDPTKNGMLTAEQFPSKPDSEDGQFTYVFKDWNPTMEPEITDMGDEKYLTAKDNMNFFATFDAVTKQYKVQWVDHNGVVGDEQNVAYGAAASTAYLPTRKNQANAYYLFGGWNESTAKVTRDMVVEPIWISANPGAPSTDVSDDLSAVEIYSLAQQVKDQGHLGDFESYIGETDQITVQLGYMPDYHNVTSKVFTEAMKTYTGKQSEMVNTGIKLFNPNQSFTLAMDFTPDYNENTALSDLFVSCMASDFRGFRLSASANTPTLQWCGSTPKELYPTHKTTQTTKHREIIVLRYEKDTTTLKIYTNDRFTVNPVSVIDMSVTNLWNVFDAPLVFGGHVNENGAATSGSYAKGIIHYAKLWYDDLGDAECKRICSWIWDEMKFERTNMQRYDREGGGKVTTSFIATELLEKDFALEKTRNDHSGWYDSQMRTWLNTKVFAAFSPEWQQVLQSTKVYSLGDKNSTVGSLMNSSNNYLTQHYSSTDTFDKLFLPGGTEITPSLVSSGETRYAIYESEQGPEALQLTSYPQFADNASRIKTYRFSDKAGFWTTRTPSLTERQNPIYVDSQGVVREASYWYDDKGGYGNFYKDTPAGVLLAFSI